MAFFSRKVEQETEDIDIPAQVQAVSQQDIDNYIEDFKDIMDGAPEEVNDKWRWAKAKVKKRYPNITAMNRWRLERRTSGVSKDSSDLTKYDHMADELAGRLLNLSYSIRRREKARFGDDPVTTDGAEDETMYEKGARMKRLFVDWLDDNDVILPNSAAHFMGCHFTTIYKYLHDLEDEGWVFEKRVWSDYTFWCVTQRPSREEEVDQNTIKEVEELTEQYLKMSQQQKEVEARLQRLLEKVGAGK